MATHIKTLDSLRVILKQYDDFFNETNLPSK